MTRFLTWYNRRWPLVVAFLLFASILLLLLTTGAPGPLVLVAACMVALGYRAVRRWLMLRLGLVDHPRYHVDPLGIDAALDRALTPAATGDTIPLDEVRHGR